jgi:ABC-2 type transport system ATP-binding protein
LTAVAVIEVDGLVKRYGAQAAVDGVSFAVEQGEIFGILGPNGAGKTTAVECVEGLRRPDAGTVRVLGLDPRADGPELRQQIGVQLQEASLPDQIKVWEALELYASFYRDPRDWRELLGEWGLADKRDAKFAKLSGGQKQRLFIALALVGNPRVAFLDELTAGLDPHARRATWELIKKIRAAGVTVVLVSHFMDEVEELCDRVAIFDRGRIVATNTPAGLIDQVDAEHRMRFRPMAEFDPGILAALPGVREIHRSGEHIAVTGTGDFASAVTGALARHHVLVADLRLEQRSLDEAYVALTGRTFER